MIVVVREGLRAYIVIPSRLILCEVHADGVVVRTVPVAWSVWSRHRARQRSNRRRDTRCTAFRVLLSLDTDLLTTQGLLL